MSRSDRIRQAFAATRPMPAARSGASAAARLLIEAQSLKDSPAAEHLGWMRLHADMQRPSALVVMTP